MSTYNSTDNLNSDHDSFLIDRLKHNYSHLHSQYRLGNAEGEVGWELKPDPASRGLEFAEFCNVGDSKPVKSFADAIADLYRLVKYIEVKRTGIATRSGELLLRCKCLIYEIKDYFLNVPEELGTYFVDFAYKLPSREQELERTAEELNGGPFKNKDERAKVIKLQLMAAIWGANQLYQEHNAHSYNRASYLLEKVNKIINETLPHQHEEVRESFGILGLAQYWTGRVLFRKGLIKESRAAFKKSADAYLARLRQKEDFCRLGLISPPELEEKVAVTIRRAALVASGDGYHYFANGQLSRALESLTLARAALTHNSGRIHLLYVDMLYWSCRRAMESSNLPKVEECIRALKSCREGFRELIPGSPHFHRAGIQLALALLYRRKLTGDIQNSDYDEGLGYLEDAIAYAERKTDKRDVLNPSLLAAAYVVKSRYQRSRYVRDSKAEPEKFYAYLNEAKDTAAWAHFVSQGIRMMQTEASASLGEVHTDLAELNLVYHKDEFPINFNASKSRVVLFSQFLDFGESSKISDLVQLWTTSPVNHTKNSSITYIHSPFGCRKKSGALVAFPEASKSRTSNTGSTDLTRNATQRRPHVGRFALTGSLHYER